MVPDRQFSNKSESTFDLPYYTNDFGCHCPIRTRVRSEVYWIFVEILSLLLILASYGQLRLLLRNNNVISTGLIK